MVWRPIEPEWQYMGRLHAAEILFWALATVLFVVLLGNRVRQRQRHAGWLAIGGLLLLVAVWFPCPYYYGFAAQFVGDVDIILAMTLAFVWFLRHDPISG